ncbi:hypothetical protein [Aestuariirhabdus litorea]|uniref:Uncharacterized protein n=1 Tax=Aestuariirhabdus litorea TaxID=2528527 RepID=A0A3P3VKJ3_9GAMM|nr:hypothetical protein [Aestuariirhabdus litorea]RRJ82827.1 hypothetical protein D0544_13330 [Aestuariirhabdus litorea]RWW92986.1 hypothetical protein DZC74_13305 [Endozoicomonadaceae bacterium GTF-13]
MGNPILSSLLLFSGILMVISVCGILMLAADGLARWYGALRQPTTAAGARKLALLVLLLFLSLTVFAASIGYVLGIAAKVL